VNENANPCLACKERACELPKIGETITKSVADIEKNLDAMQDAIGAAETDLKAVVNKILDHVKAIVADSVKHLSNTFQDVNCGVVGDIYNTMFASTCADAMPGFKDYSWLFVWCSFFGIICIIATILLNICVGLRPLDDQHNATAGHSEVEMSGRNNAYLSADAVPSANALAYVPASVPPANGNPTPVNTASKNLYPSY